MTTESKRELMSGMTSEEIIALYFNEDALKTAPEQLYRLESNGKRLYYKFDEEGEPKFFLSITSLISMTTPTSKFLQDWKIQKALEEGYAKAGDDFARARAAYGSFMHTEFAELLINRTYDIDKVNEKLKTYLDKNSYPGEWINWSDDLKSDILAFAQFMIDCNVKPLAIEIGLSHPEDGYATLLDLVCTMTTEVKGFFGEYYKTGKRAGEPKETKQLQEINAIIDFKSGRNGFYPDHEVQLHGCLKLWNYHFPDVKIDRLFNWSPKDWIEKPGYHLKDQTDSKEALKLPHLINIAKIEFANLNRKIIVKEGIIDLTKGLQSNVKECDIYTIVKEKRFKNNEPEKDEIEKDLDL